MQITAERIYDEFNYEGARTEGIWLIGYQTAVQIRQMLTVGKGDDKITWDGELLLGRPVKLHVGEGLVYA